MSRNNCASFTWAIHNFSYCWQKNDEAIVSPMFSIYMPEETKWKLQLFPRGVASEEDIVFHLLRDNDCKGTEKIKLEYTVDFLAIDGSSLVDITKANEFQRNMRRGSSRYITKTKTVTRHLQQDILTIRLNMIRLNEKVVKMRQIFARTIIAIEKRFFQWPVESFSDLEPNQVQTFLIKSESKEVIMQINLSLASDNEESICFSIYSFDRRLKFSTMKTFIIDSQKQEVDSGQYQYWFNCGNCAKFHLKLSKKELLENKSLYLPNNLLNLNFELTVSTGIAFEGIERGSCEYDLHPFPNDTTENWQKCISHKNISNCPCALITDLTSLHNDQSTCDMKLQTKSNTFPVHTLILSARSPVFKAMFSKDMKEKFNGCVDVSDLEDETVRRFLLYLYSDQLEDLRWSDAFQLFIAADKYAIISLRDICSTVLKNKLTLENACEILVLSDLHQDEDLKEITQKFILKNARVIFKSEEWQIFADENSKLALETMLRNWNEE
ncbi:unnamed protein product [Larinioides sclopetarius]|uniref:Speckle-type POZ protein n=1 Tax=Larinioides sclopetarius TaxID=280406 RepID=A0AAV2BA65_9ARAC